MQVICASYFVKDIDFLAEELECIENNTSLIWLTDVCELIFMHKFKHFKQVIS